MNALEAVFVMGMELGAPQCAKAQTMREECFLVGNQVDQLIPLIEKYLPVMLSGNGGGGGGATDDVSDPGYVQCEGDFLKKPKMRVGLTSEKWDERYFRLYANRLEYGTRSKPFVPRSKPFAVNHLTVVLDKPSSPKKFTGRQTFAGKANEDVLVLALSFQSSEGEGVGKELFKFEDNEAGQDFKSKLQRNIER
jgi:hypothetical protein